MKLKDGTVVKKWIEEQWVGNEELGTIFHEYDLKKNVKRKGGSQPATPLLPTTMEDFN